MEIINNLRDPLSLPGKILDWFTRDMHSTWGLAVARIIVGLFTVLLFFIEWKDRLVFFGPGSNWAQPYKDESLWTAPWYHFFTNHESAMSFTIKWIIMGLLGLAVMVGYKARLTSGLLFFVLTSLVAQGPTTNDSEDIVTRILLLLFVFADTSQRLSVDRWLAEKRGKIVDYGGLRPMRDGLIPMRIRIPVHNAALVVIAAQITIVYFFAGVAKLSGPLWRDGTATYYPFHADFLTPWPELSHLLGQNTLMTMAMTYGSIFVQLAFPFMLLHKYTRLFIIIAMIGLHVGIGLFLGLGLFSLAMCGADLAFIRDSSVDKYLAKLRHIPMRRHSNAPEYDDLGENPADVQAGKSTI